MKKFIEKTLDWFWGKYYGFLYTVNNMTYADKAHGGLILMYSLWIVCLVCLMFMAP